MPFLIFRYRLGNSPDNDLCYVINAKHFITTGGGYGYFLGNMVKMNGGNFVLNNSETHRPDRNYKHKIKNNIHYI